MPRTSRVVLFGAILGLLAVEALPCTSFRLSSREDLVVGYSFDYYTPIGRLTTNRRGVRKTACWSEAGFRWVSRFGSVTFSQFGYQFPANGINEAGLVVEQMSLDGTRYPVDTRPDIYSLQWVQYQLDCSANIEDVLANERNVRITPAASSIHFLITDRSGRSVVIDYVGGQLRAYHDATLPIPALTNDTYENSLAYAAVTAPANAGLPSSLGRFVHAAAGVRAFAADPPADPVRYAFELLERVRIPGWSRWNLVYDVGNMVVYYRTTPVPAIKHVHLDQIDFSPTAPILIADLNDPAGGEIALTTPYTRADNEAVLLAAYLARQPNGGYPDWIREEAAYPDGFTRAAGPDIIAQPQSRTVAAGLPLELSVIASGAWSLQWQRNGVDVPGATDFRLRIEALQPSDAGIYTAVVSNWAGSVVSEPAIVGLISDQKIIGSGREYAGDIHHAASGNTYDQFLLTGPAASLTCDPGQIARISYVDLSDDIVQVEFSGPGTLTLSLQNASGPALPRNYEQAIGYMRGHATVVLSGATAETHLCIYSVGALTNPAVVRAGENYDGHADLAALAIQSLDGLVGNLRCGNTAFSAAAGLTGVFAPGVRVAGAVSVHDVSAADTAFARLQFGPDTRVRITGGDLWQMNGSPVRVVGIPVAGVTLAAGTSSGGVFEPSLPLRGRITEGETDVSVALVVRER